MDFNGSPPPPSRPQSDPPFVDPSVYPGTSFPPAKRFDLGPRAWIIFSVLFLATIGTTWMEGGPWFSLSLILILTAHEFGHYFACVKNKTLYTYKHLPT